MHTHQHTYILKKTLGPSGTQSELAAGKRPLGKQRTLKRRISKPPLFLPSTRPALQAANQIQPAQVKDFAVEENLLPSQATENLRHQQNQMTPAAPHVDFLKLLCYWQGACDNVIPCPYGVREVIEHNHFIAVQQFLQNETNVPSLFS